MNATTPLNEASPAPHHAPPSTSAHERVQPSEWWANHFRVNQRREWGIPWDSPQTLPPAALAAIAPSIAEFQRGESSEARNYLAKSALFSGRTGDPAFHAASILFVREENGHAALLLRFMQRVGIPPRQKSFADGAFRWLRGFGDTGWASRVLIIAELIAQEYYPCLRAATDHPVLMRICDKVIFDEEAHIRFQVERIVRVEAALDARSLALRDLLLATLMRGTAVLVYLGHRGVLAPQLSMRQFVERVVTRNRRAIEAMQSLRAGSSFGIAAGRSFSSPARS